MSGKFLSGVGRSVITPEKGLGLAGYFNPRFNVGKIDDLFAKAVAMQQGESRLVAVSCDLCFITAEIVCEARRQLTEAGFGEWSDHLLVMATHSHTAPYPAEFFGDPADPDYLALLHRRIAEAAAAAIGDLGEAELLSARRFGNPYAFNRRYWMKNGSVMTNPGKCNPDIARPEGPVDDEIGLLAIRKSGKIAALLANIVNHTDTIGGDLVSADWPGFMERKVRSALGESVSVVTLIGCSGNINHFDVSDSFDQTSADEARRIGEGYGAILLDMLKTLAPVDFSRMTVKRSILTIPYRVISAAEKAAAEATVKRTEGVNAGAALTSEELAAGDGAVARFFAEQLLDYAERCSGKARDFELFTVQFDDKLALQTFPGECFTEIGLAVKAGSPAAQTLVATLAMGECGYVCMPGCFARGGYEILPVVGGGPACDTAPRMVREAIRLLWS